jgi:hypothetical protein
MSAAPRVALADLAAPTSQADRSTRLGDVDDLAVLSDLDPALDDKLGGGGAGCVHERAEVRAGERSGSIRGTNSLARSAATEQLDDYCAQAIVFRCDRTHG